ncbi:MAG: hypothetical protein JOZ14_09800 [Acidobacteria bacterium]|nr:hypothetical protein [Acidobacteriota bacterium]
MESAQFPKNRWNLTQEAFDLLLAQLDDDREQAGIKYESLRRKLMRFFEWRGCTFAEDLADEAINRTAKNIGRGEKIGNLPAYCAGIARNVFLESLRSRKRQAVLEPSAQASATRPDESRRQCLERCLRELLPEDCSLIMEYYREEKGSRIQRRRELAVRLGIPLNALRIRAHRIRVRLQICVEHCMERFLRE